MILCAISCENFVWNITTWPFFSFHHIDACACGKTDAAFHEKSQIHWIFLPEILQHCNSPLTQPIANIFRNMQLLSVLVRPRKLVVKTFEHFQSKNMGLCLKHIKGECHTSVNSVLQTNVSPQEHRICAFIRFQIVCIQLTVRSIACTTTLTLPNRSLLDHFFTHDKNSSFVLEALASFFLLGKNQIV